METIEFTCTEDEDSGFLIAPCHETTDMYVCINNDYVYISKHNAIKMANEILKHYNSLSN